MHKKLTTDEFIQRAKEVHGDKYDYSLVECKDAKTKVKIICPKHGEFEQRAINHLSNHGCAKCQKTRLLTLEQFIERAKKIHGNKYDYSLVEYKGLKVKVKIICPTHGVFSQSPKMHLEGHNCIKCFRQNSKLTTNEFIQKAKDVHGDKYDYSISKYVGFHFKIKITCPTHGVFEQTPASHLGGNGCIKCGREKTKVKNTMMTKDFIRKAKNIHGNKYDYSLVDYKNSKIKIKIICPTHGAFEQFPNHHLRKHQCPKCTEKNIETEDFIKKAKKIHGDKYDYSKTQYKDSSTKIIITCLLHGDFKKNPSNHLNNQGCPKCALISRSKKRAGTTENFIKKAKQIHGNKYDYSMTEFINSETKVIIICPIHGQIQQFPKSHLKSQGCPKCARNIQKTTNEFIVKAKEVHGNKYNYSLVDYKNSKTKVKIICPTHGVFEQTPNGHLLGQNCPRCVGGKQKTNEEFIEDAIKIHENKYDYSKVIYINNKTKVIITCPIHGDFPQVPSTHLSGNGCPKCASSHGENEIIKILDKNFIIYNLQHKFEKCINFRQLPFDFYLPENPVCVEFHGTQHFYPIKHFGEIKYFKIRKKNDKTKEMFCKNNNIPLIIVFKDHYNDKIIKFVDLFNNAPKEIINVFKNEKMIQYSLREYENFKQKMLRKN